MTGSGRPRPAGIGREVADVVLPAARRVQVEEAHRRVAPVGEGVDGARRGAGVRAGRRLQLLIAEPDGQCPLEDEERVEHLPVEVRGGPLVPGWIVASAREKAAGGRLPRSP